MGIRKNWMQFEQGINCKWKCNNDVVNECFLFIYVWTFWFIAQCTMHTYTFTSNEIHNTHWSINNSVESILYYCCYFFTSSHVFCYCCCCFFILFILFYCYVSSTDRNRTHFSHIVHIFFVEAKLMFVSCFCFSHFFVYWFRSICWRRV